MNNAEYKRLEKFVATSNIIKYSLGLPLLVFNSLRFYKRLLGTYARLYAAIVTEPEKIKDELEYVGRLKKGLKILWEPNKLRIDD
jgi:hypothetical protein